MTVCATTSNGVYMCRPHGIDCWQHHDEMIMYVLCAGERQNDGHSRFSPVICPVQLTGALPQCSLEPTTSMPTCHGQCVKRPEAENNGNQLKKSHDVRFVNILDGKDLSTFYNPYFPIHTLDYVFLSILWLTCFLLSIYLSYIVASLTGNFSDFTYFTHCTIYCKQCQ